MHKQIKKRFLIAGALIVAAAAIFFILFYGASRKEVASLSNGTNEPPAACPEKPMLSVSPVDVSLATSVLYPGQYRNGDYKTHGGLRFDRSKPGDIVVKAPMEAKVVQVGRYLELGEVQYLLHFENDCGFAYRFDHLSSLSPKLQRVAEEAPQPKEGDSRTTRVGKPVVVEAGEVVATAVGFSKIPNVGVDFGVYDLRRNNDISSIQQWAAIHQNQAELAFHGLCWIDLLPEADASVLKRLPPGDRKSKAISDYCVTSDGNTLKR